MIPVLWFAAALFVFIVIVIAIISIAWRNGDGMRGHVAHPPDYRDMTRCNGVQHVYYEAPNRHQHRCGEEAPQQPTQRRLTWRERLRGQAMEQPRPQQVVHEPASDLHREDDREVTPQTQPPTARPAAATGNQNPMCQQCGAQQVAEKFHKRCATCAQTPICLESGCGQKLRNPRYSHCLNHETVEERTQRQQAAERRQAREATAAPRPQPQATAAPDPEIEALFADS